ncbi:hypothetical protein [uncultured Campylobacter sp.]|uniref:hypothetical protein n=1 Tax=uncultured Campylobacter sp. TaxID=218934 RepID=UPI00260EBAA7|nr:hypothetical protein [uncultured Campylobacter sp.]
MLSYDKGITNQTLCRICNIRKIPHDNDKCEICSAFVRLGERLASDSKKINSKDIGIDFIDSDIEISESIRSYVAK